MTLRTLPGDPRRGTPRATPASVGSSSSAEPPHIHAVGEVPERHADRVVAEMLRWIVAERQRRKVALYGILNLTPDSNPQAQQKLADKLRRLGGEFFPAVALMKSGKRGRYEIRIMALDGWNRDTQELIFNANKIPERPQLAASIIVVKGLGNHQYGVKTVIKLIVSHHSLSRLVQRSQNRTVDDLLAAVTSLFMAYAEAGFQIDGNESRLRFPTNGGDVIARLERHWDDSGKVIAATITEIDPGGIIS